METNEKYASEPIASDVYDHSEIDKAHEHEFLECDEWARTCLCGAQEYEEKEKLSELDLDQHGQR